MLPIVSDFVLHHLNANKQNHSGGTIRFRCVCTRRLSILVNPCRQTFFLRQQRAGSVIRCYQLIFSIVPRPPPPPLTAQCRPDEHVFIFLLFLVQGNPGHSSDGLNTSSAESPSPRRCRRPPFPPHCFTKPFQSPGCGRTRTDSDPYRLWRGPSRQQFAPRCWCGCTLSCTRGRRSESGECWKTTSLFCRGKHTADSFCLFVFYTQNDNQPYLSNISMCTCVP